MSVFFISDLHFGHKRILDFAGDVFPDNLKTVDDHAEYVVRQWNSVITNKRFLVYILGDLMMDSRYASYVRRLNGRKRLIFGNHDDLWWGEGRGEIALKSMSITGKSWHNTMLEYMGIEMAIPYQPMRYKDYWLSHCPIHPDEIRRKVANIHGHVHTQTVDDPRYFKVCVENCPNHAPISLDEIKRLSKIRGLT